MYAYLQRSLLRHSIGEYTKAIKDCDKAIKIDPNYKEAYEMGGLAKYFMRCQAKYFR